MLFCLGDGSNQFNHQREQEISAAFPEHLWTSCIFQNNNIYWSEQTDDICRFGTKWDYLTSCVVSNQNRIMHIPSHHDSSQTPCVYIGSENCIANSCAGDACQVLMHAQRNASFYRKWLSTQYKQTHHTVHFHWWYLFRTFWMLLISNLARISWLIFQTEKQRNHPYPRQWRTCAYKITRNI